MQIKSRCPITNKHAKSILEAKPCTLVTGDPVKARISFTDSYQALYGMETQGKVDQALMEKDLLASTLDFYKSILALAYTYLDSATVDKMDISASDYRRYHGKNYAKVKFYDFRNKFYLLCKCTWLGKSKRDYLLRFTYDKDGKEDIKRYHVSDLRKAVKVFKLAAVLMDAQGYVPNGDDRFSTGRYRYLKDFYEYLQELDLAKTVPYEDVLKDEMVFDQRPRDIGKPYLLSYYLRPSEYKKFKALAKKAGLKHVPTELT